MKKMASLLMVLCFLLVGGTANAFADEIPTPPLSQISSNPNYASVSWRNPAFINGNPDGIMGTGQDGLQIVFASASISKASSSSVSIYATTESNIISNEIGGIIYIERWNNNGWENYDTYSFRDYFIDVCSGSATIGVESGYYYRLSVTHIAGTGFSTKSAYSTTASVLVN
jgi:hypothetical protein